MSNSPITDVIFDFCGVLLDWQTRACLTGHFPQDTVDAICAPDDPHGFFRYEDRMDAGEDFSHIYPDVVSLRSSPTTSNITATPCRACCPAWKICCAT